MPEIILAWLVFLAALAGGFLLVLLASYARYRLSRNVGKRAERFASETQQIVFSAFELLSAGVFLILGFQLFGPLAGALIGGFGGYAIGLFFASRLSPTIADKVVRALAARGPR